MIRTRRRLGNLAATASQRYPYLVPVLSLILAASTAFNTFFGWEQMHKSFILTESELNHLLVYWKGETFKARAEPYADGKARVLKAFDSIIEKANAVDTADTTSYFSSTKLPDKPK